jgi:dGTPase
VGEGTDPNGISRGNGSRQTGRPEVGNSSDGDREPGSPDEPAATGSGPGPNDSSSASESLATRVSLYGSADWKRDCEESTLVDAWRNSAHRDYARVIHSPSWRRLQGKTQLFPGHESDFFRNRLTHSLEVAQVAEAIALRLNAEHPYFSNNNLDCRLCMTAGLMHDLGHPPFGHNGEHALDDSMKEFGGFEGNAQTLRIISKLEKKARRAAESGLADDRAGLNLCHRTIASALKYDRIIPHVREDDEGLVKGYYADDAELISRVKAAVAPSWSGQSFKTIECSIMDLADDIAYSTYDLEDSLKAGFLTPASILSSDDELLDRVALKVSRAVDHDVTREDVLGVLVEIFAGVVGHDEPDLLNIVRAFRASHELASDGYNRTALTAQLVGEMVRSVEIDVNEQFPMMSKARLTPEALLKVETLKNYTFEATIFSTRLKVAEFRGYEVITAIFDALSGPKGHLMMPDDVRTLHRRFEANATARMRVVCDFIAGMTDRYAVEFYSRLHSDAGQSIFKPL